MFPQAPVPQTPAQRKLAYVAGRRSMAEMERLLYRFMVEELTDLNDEVCGRMEVLLHYPDADLLDWIAGLKTKPVEVDGEALARLGRYVREFVVR